jgi:hypothetical protein
MQMGGGEDLDCVEVGIGQEVVERTERAGRTPGLGRRRRPPVDWIAHGHHVAARIHQVAVHVERGDVARADDPDPRTVSRT